MNERVEAAAKAYLEAPRTRGMDTSGPMRAALAAADAPILALLDEMQSKMTTDPDASGYDLGFDDGVRGTIDAIRAALKGDEG